MFDFFPGTHPETIADVETRGITQGVTIISNSSLATLVAAAQDNRVRLDIELEDVADYETSPGIERRIVELEEVLDPAKDWKC